MRSGAIAERSKGYLCKIKGRRPLNYKFYLKNNSGKRSGAIAERSKGYIVIKKKRRRRFIFKQIISSFYIQFRVWSGDLESKKVASLGTMFEKNHNPQK